MDAEEAVKWATLLKILLDLGMALFNRPLSLADLEQIIESEEVKSRLLELRRKELVNVG